MHIAFAPFRVKPDISEADLVAASDDFEARFVKEQEGIVRRVLVKDGVGGYADIVYFEDLDSIERVLAAEQASEVCAAFFSIMEGEDSHRVYEVIKTYD